MIVIIFLIIPLFIMFFILLAEIMCFRRKKITWQNCQKCMAYVLCSNRRERPLTEEEANEISKILSDTDENEKGYNKIP